MVSFRHSRQRSHLIHRFDKSEAEFLSVFYSESSILIFQHPVIYGIIWKILLQDCKIGSHLHDVTLPRLIRIGALVL
ncbi:MAG TPA: hypothetical protein VKU79_02380, partial [Thermoplasmataceae archaeon]|nr:hypothetical protein [Thermoplasmataceae archaeon]